MRNIFTIFSREIRSYFNSAIAYIFIIVFLLISCGVFMTQFFLLSTASMRGFFNIMPVVLCIFLPVVTMGLWAEDRKGNTLELLLTFPMRTHELVVGKYLGSLVFFIASLVATMTVPLTIIILGKPDMGVIICQYIGTMLVGSFFLSLGLFISGFCKDQIVSFIMAMMACFLFFLLGTPFITTSIDGWIPGLGTFLRNSLGMTYHFDSFQKGVVDIGNIIYFVIGTLIFLVLNGFWLESRLRPKAKIIFTTAGLIGICIFAVVNFIFSDMPTARFDFTELKTYTISGASREILQELKAPVLIKLFISPTDKMPSGLKMIERDIRDKLDEFRAASRGKLDYKVFHLEAANVATEEDTLEKSIEKKGIRPLRVRSVEADEIGVKLIYSAISIAYKDKTEQIMPRVLPDNIESLEYMIMSSIYKMSLDKTPSVAIVAPYKDKAQDPKIKEALAQASEAELESFREDPYKLIPKILEYEGYNVKRIKLSEDEPIPDDTTTLIIIEPSSLNERQKFEINRFLVKGGSLFLAVQKYNFEYKPYESAAFQIVPQDKNPQINSLLEPWGFGVDDDFLMDLQCDVVSLTGARLFGVIPVTSPIKLPIQIKVVQAQMNKDISITSNLDTMLYLWGSALKIDYDKINNLNLKATVLFNSSADAWERPYHNGALTNEDLAVPEKASRKSFPLSVFAEGQFPNAFEGKDIPEWPKKEGDNAASEASYEKPKADNVGLSPKPGKLILIGCAGIFSENMLEQGGHVNFFLNSVETITLGGKLINIRSKQTADRTMKRLSPTAKASWRIFNTFLIPVVLAVIGGFRIFLRKRSKWIYLKTV